MNNPYEKLPDYCFWRKVMCEIPPGQINPGLDSEVKITQADKVSTIGSCFAQHISSHLTKLGVNYFVAEKKPENMTIEEGISNNYGTFSARYGSVYTVRQALQTFLRAFGEFNPQESEWSVSNGFVDSFRPQIESLPFQNCELLSIAREYHLECVRKIFVESDWLIFTPGLTEAWVSIVDGAVYPTAPGVVAGNFDDTRHGFYNFNVVEIIDDLTYLIDRIRSVNNKLKILLTVSPVPLIATYENRHVLVSTVASKSSLRAACEIVTKKKPNVYYFPSYEIVTSAANCGQYYEPDLRSVSRIGVDHVMRAFSASFVDERVYVSSPNVAGSGSVNNYEVVCDEEVIQRAYDAGRFGRFN
jgi:hypothetical protein